MTEVKSEVEESPVKAAKSVDKGRKSEGDSSDSAPVVSADGVTPGKKNKGVKKEKIVEKSQTNQSAVEDNQAESGSGGARPKDQLNYLSKIIGFKVINLIYLYFKVY